MEGIDILSRLQPYISRRIGTLSESGLNNDTLIREDNVQISRPGISLFLKWYNATGVYIYICSVGGLGDKQYKQRLSFIK
jgi:hypothetical protein